MKKILLIGSGAREHAIAKALKRSKKEIELYVYGNSLNPGIKELSSGYMVGKLEENARIVAFGTENHCDMSIIGPEAPLEAGLADALDWIDIPCVGPFQNLAQIESSKSFARNLLTEYSIGACPSFKVFEEFEGVKDYLNELGGNFVIKPDGLTGGKGVKVSGDHFNSIREGADIVYELLEQGNRVVVEEKLIGQEFSLLSLSDGDHLLHLPAAQDYKRAYINDKGPNTGGMGTYSMADFSLPFLTEQDIAEARNINESVAFALKDKYNQGYKGVLYGGFIATKDGIKVIEYNARFGDPEAMNVLSLFDGIEADFLEVCEAILDGTLLNVSPILTQKATVCKYVAPDGYPDKSVKGELIDLSQVDETKVDIYYSSVNQKEDGLYLGGSRAVAIVGIHDDVYEAEKIVETEIQKIQGPIFHREDIGTEDSIQRKIQMMNDIRNCNHDAKKIVKNNKHIETSLELSASQPPTPQTPIPQINLAVFASTNGTDLQAILDAKENGELPEVNLKFVLSNQKDCYALERARMAGIKTIFVSQKEKKREEFDAECLEICNSHDIDLIVMIGYMRYVTNVLLKPYKNKIMNIHPSLLPKYPGMDLNVHKEVLENNEKETGCTLHFATIDPDSGPIILQEKVTISPDDTPTSLKTKVQEKEKIIILKGIKMFARGEINIKQDSNNVGTTLGLSDQKESIIKHEPMKKTALISVSNKDGVVELAKGLEELGWQIISTGGTFRILSSAGIENIMKVEDFTGFPEIMDGRVKTLHPKIYGGLLADRTNQEHLNEAENNGIPMIDMIVCNLYPFKSASEDKTKTHSEVIENIDIGGVSLLRAAAKNYKSVLVVTDPSDYSDVVGYLKKQKELNRELARKAFSHTSSYDEMIASYFDNGSGLNMHFDKMYDVRYGENSHQKACFYKDKESNPNSIVNAEILHGKKLSFNNLLDADGAINLIREFTEPAAAVLKHTNPCGCAVADNIDDAFRRAYETDPLSAFGGIVVLNRPCTQDIAEYINSVFAEIVIAPDYEPTALAILQEKKNIRILKMGDIKPLSREDTFKDYKKINGGVLEQEYNALQINESDLRFVTVTKPTAEQIRDILFGWRTVKHVKSNAILLAKDLQTVGIGAGQMSRVDAVEIAIKKAGNKVPGCVVASDAFFPFRDSIDQFAKVGITAVIQPGGSIKDKEVIAACNTHGIAMVFTGYRVFRH